MLVNVIVFKHVQQLGVLGAPVDVGGTIRELPQCDEREVGQVEKLRGVVGRYAYDDYIIEYQSMERRITEEMGSLVVRKKKKVGRL